MGNDQHIEVYNNGEKISDGKGIVGLVWIGEEDGHKATTQHLCIGNLSIPQWAVLRDNMLSDVLEQGGIGNPMVKMLVDIKEGKSASGIGLLDMLMSMKNKDKDISDDPTDAERTKQTMDLLEKLDKQEAAI